MLIVRPRNIGEREIYPYLSRLEKLIRERKLPRPLFNERCALVYLHHYDSSKP